MVPSEARPSTTFLTCRCRAFRDHPWGCPGSYAQWHCVFEEVGVAWTSLTYVLAIWLSVRNAHHFLVVITVHCLHVNLQSRRLVSHAWKHARGIRYRLDLQRTIQRYLKSFSVDGRSAKLEPRFGAYGVPIHSLAFAACRSHAVLAAVLPAPAV